MQYAGFILSIIVIIIVAKLLLKNYFPQAVLLIAGITMLLIKGGLDYFNHTIVLKENSFLLINIFEFMDYFFKLFFAEYRNSN